MTNSFKDIFAWQKSYEYCLCVYQFTSSFPDFEKFGLCSQFTRAAVSIPANIAEGYKKLSRADKLRFFNISQGSLEECRFYNLLSKDLGYITDEQFYILENKLNVASSMLNSYVNGVKNNIAIDKDPF